MPVSYLDVAERFLAATYPAATTALIGGSTARAERTETSDIDLLVIGDDLFPGDNTARASTHRFEDEIFEVFAYTPGGFTEWALRDLGRHRPVIVRMLVDGIPVRDDGTLPALQVQWRARLESGPSVDAHEIAVRRYIITDLIDDLRDATDRVELNLIAGLLYERLAELMLLTNGCWIGSGKWLPRLLHTWDPERADALASAWLTGEHLAFVAHAEHELALAGGRVQAGFVR